MDGVEGNVFFFEYSRNSLWLGIGSYRALNRAINGRDLSTGVSMVHIWLVGGGCPGVVVLGAAMAAGWPWP